MIAFCQSAPPLKEPETLISCRMQTLHVCYGTLPNALDWYKSDAGGVLCRFGSALLILGNVDYGELFSFSDLLGVTRIEWITDIMTPYSPPNGWTSTSHPVLHGIGGGAPNSEIIETDIELRSCFSLLCKSDEQFEREAEYLPWLSDMTRRRNAGRAEVFMHADAAVACVTAKGHHSAYLSSVAVLPKKRGTGMGLALVRAVVAHPTLRGIDIFTAAQSEALVGFYLRAGFSVLPQLLTITEKRNS